MNEFTVLFKNDNGQVQEQIMSLNFNGVNAVINWFDNVLDTKVISISKH